MPIVVFADGASSGNPGPGGWGAIIIDETQQVQELGQGEAHTTNNRMELGAAIGALQAIREKALPGREIQFYTDSTYLIQGITRWIHGWKRNGWKTSEGKEVLNRELWEKLDSELHSFFRAGIKIHWNHVPGHSGVPGNERADVIAVQMSQGLSPELFQGSLQDYPIPILDLAPTKKKTAPAGAAKGPSYYLSWVGNTLARHATWAECEARVKGVPEARFKKVSSPEEEKETLASWGVSG